MSLQGGFHDTRAHILTTRLRPASDGPEETHRPKTSSFSTGPTTTGNKHCWPPEPIGKFWVDLTTWRKQVAKLLTLGFFWPDEWGIFSERKAREGVSQL